MATPVYSLSISAEAVIDMHSLNNEGGEGNQIQTRMVNIVDCDGRLCNVNAISGDMFKHIQAEHFFRLASGRLPLCDGCGCFNANRISADADYEAFVSGPGVSDAAALDRLIKDCALDDVAGNLITSGKRSLPRKSVVEFGWIVAQPEHCSTDSYFHVKYASERSEERRAADSKEESRGANLGQAIFHRPASSGVYAIVSTVEAARIGFNDITQTYPLDDADRLARYQALLESLLYTLIQPNGAMRGTQHPHILDVRGVVAVSTQVVPAPTMSALNPAYHTQIVEIAGMLNHLHPDAVQVHAFGSLSEFAKVMTGLIGNTTPYRLAYGA